MSDDITELIDFKKQFTEYVFYIKHVLLNKAFPIMKTN